MNSKELAEKLEQYPDLKCRFEELLKIIENDHGGEILSAHVAEQRVIDSLRDLGKETLENWGKTTSDRVCGQVREKLPSARKDVKKSQLVHNLWTDISRGTTLSSSG